MTSPADRAAFIKAHARGLGFDACGIAAAVDTSHIESHFTEWLDAGYHADMHWLAETADTRLDVRRKLPNARSVIVVARNYYAPRPESVAGTGRVSRYAWGRDYHKVLRTPMNELARAVDALESEASSFISVDTGPVLERTWAAHAGIGWLGKNGLLIHPEFGSWVFLGVIVTTVDLQPDRPIPNRCGACRRCIDACPTGAIRSPRMVDSRRCIAYHTIENRGAIPPEIAERLEDRVFGCDACQEVCPWNHAPVQTTEDQFLPRPGVANPMLDALLAMDETEFLRLFAGTPVSRAKLAGIVRNACLSVKHAAYLGENSQYRR